jgi:MYXO-CTERM domain-containing protein
MKDNFEWALDPNTSCGAGCPNPWNGPPIIWTPQGPGAPTYPGFDADTFSIMPSCDPGQFDPDACTGSGTAIHTGLELADATIADYRANPPALYPVNPDTTFANILITDGQYNIGGWSTDEQVSGALTDLFANDGITTYVIGFGDQISTTELNNMACWGSGGTGIPCENGTVAAFDAGNQVELASALETIIEQINFDPCCNFNDCSFNPEPTTGEADPVPTDTSSSGSDSADTTDGLTSGPGTTDGTGDSGQVVESGSDSNASATMGSVTATSANTTTVGSDDGGETDTDTDTAGGASDDSGCGCRTDGNGGRGWLGTLFALILLGGARRRRRG